MKIIIIICFVQTRVTYCRQPLPRLLPIQDRFSLSEGTERRGRVEGEKKRKQRDEEKIRKWNATQQKVLMEWEAMNDSKTMEKEGTE